MAVWAHYIISLHVLLHLSGRSLSSSTASNPLLWISTRNEGLTEHLNQLNKIWHHAYSKCQRHISIVPFKNTEHYNDTGYINLCDFFVFPSSISCANLNPFQVIQNYSCSMPPCSPRQWYCKADAFGLGTNSTFPIAVAIRKPNLCEDSCSLLKQNLPPDGGKHFEIKLTDKYMNIMLEVQHKLSSTPSTTHNTTHSSKYTAVHWRRGDQLVTRCQSHIDTSVNCQDVETFITTVQNSTQQTGAVYVSTNEKDAAALAKLHEAGFHTSASLGLRGSSIEIFVVELMLMIRADVFLHWGISTVSGLVTNARKQDRRPHPAD